MTRTSRLFKQVGGITRSSVPQYVRRSSERSVRFNEHVSTRQTPDPGASGVWGRSRAVQGFELTFEPGLRLARSER